MNANRSDIHQTITDRIILAIEASPGKWQRPWQAAAPMRRPVNAASGKAYRGINTLALWVEAQHKGYGSPRWGTYQQWASLGRQVRKGSVASTVVFYKALDPRPPSEGKDDAPRPALIARTSPVFNADQVEGDDPVTAVPVAVPDPIAAVDLFVAAAGAEIRHGGDRAYFAPTADLICMPPMASFTGSATTTALEGYYSTLLHELTHWTGPPHRCDRQLESRFGSDAYAMEELVAELGAAFLCADLGISNDLRQDHAQYLAHWLRVLKADKRAIFTAAGKAAQAVDYLQAAASATVGGSATTMTAQREAPISSSSEEMRA